MLHINDEIGHQPPELGRNKDHFKEGVCLINYNESNIKTTKCDYS